MSYIDDFNTGLRDVKAEIQNLFDRAKEQVISLEDKSNSSFTELSSIYRRDSLLEDTFVDGSKVSSSEGLVYDKDGWTNSFRVNEIKFLPDYYGKATYPMIMAGGQVIPGSDFSAIFKDREGFWGYMRDDDTEVESSFTLALDTTRGIPDVNKVYLRTNNNLVVEARYRESDNSQWISLGTRMGQHHVWTTLFKAVEISFVATTNIFSVSLVQVGEATFGLTGALESTYYPVDNLRILSIEKDADIPEGTAIRTFVSISSDPDQEIPASGLIRWEDKTIVLLAAEEYSAPSYSGYIIPSGFVEESLSVREGYGVWDEVNTIDYSVVTESVDRLGTTYLDVPSGYKIVTGGVKALYTGDGDTRVEYGLGDDYTVIYDVDMDTIRVTYTNTGRLPTTPEVEPKAEVILRRPNAVVQRRAFVYLDIDMDIDLTIPTTGVTVRTLHIDDSVADETTVQNVPVGVYTVSGKEGLNLIEVEGFNAGTPPEFVGSYKFFSTRYRLERSATNPPSENEFDLEPMGGGLKLVTASENLFIRYLVPTANNNVAVRFEMEGTSSVAPTLRGYRLVNMIDRI